MLYYILNKKKFHQKDNTIILVKSLQCYYSEIAHYLSLSSTNTDL